MGRTNRTTLPAAYSPERRENQLIALAVDLAEKQLRDGTATSQVITHYLKLSSEQSKLEIEKMRRENELLEAKTENLRSASQMDEMYANAMRAISDYSFDDGGLSDEYN